MCGVSKLLQGGSWPSVDVVLLKRPLCCMLQPGSGNVWPSFLPALQPVEAKSRVEAVCGQKPCEQLLLSGIGSNLSLSTPRAVRYWVTHTPPKGIQAAVNAQRPHRVEASPEHHVTSSPLQKELTCVPSIRFGDHFGGPSAKLTGCLGKF